MDKEKNKQIAIYIIGSIVITAISMILFPKIIEAVSSVVYGKMPRKTTTLDDDWGPEIVKRTVKENK